MNIEEPGGAEKSTAPLTRHDIEYLQSTVEHAVQLDLHRKNLQEADLSYMDLQGANLQGTDLRGAILRGTNLSHANLHGADLSGADLDGANLSGASLGDSDASRVKLQGAKLSYAMLRELDLRGFNLANLDLRNADLSGTDLRDAVLRGTDLQGADLSTAHLNGPELQGALLHRGAFPGDAGERAERKKRSFLSLPPARPMIGSTLEIRTESVTDYAAIGALHARAFGNRTGEPIIVALLRQRRAFDPELSLVAEREGQIVGHALFSPYSMRLLDQSVSVVNLAPLAVDPAFQGQGIGGRLIQAGHVLAAAKGYTVSILLGHPTYYPRFGYQTHAFGSAQLSLSFRPPADELLETRSPTAEDVIDLCALWQDEEKKVDMALAPGGDLLDWLSPHPFIQATIYLRAGQVVGYTRIHNNEPTCPRVFLARDREAARSILATIASKLRPTSPEVSYTLPLHPFSSSAAFLGQADSTSWEAAMACELSPSPLPDYLAAIREKRRPVGRPIWPVAFDLA